MKTGECTFHQCSTGAGQEFIEEWSHLPPIRDTTNP